MHLPLNSVNRQLSTPPFLNPFEPYSDSRKHGYQGSSRNVRLGRVIPSGGGALAKSDDGMRCAVTGKECRGSGFSHYLLFMTLKWLYVALRIIRISETPQVQSSEHKSVVGQGGHRIEASRNFWDGSGLKIDSASTDIAWGHGCRCSLFSSCLVSDSNNSVQQQDLYQRS